MALVTGNSPFDMRTLSTFVEDGTELYADNSVIRILMPDNTVQEYRGSFEYTFDPGLNGYVITGGFISSVTEYYDTNFVIRHRLEGMELTIAEYDAFASANDAAGLVRHIFRGNDTIGGTGTGDYLLGYEGDDTFVWLSGTSHADGGAGNDRATFAGMRDAYQITRGDGQVTVTALIGVATAATLVNIESIQFANEAVVVNHAPAIALIAPAPAHGTTSLAVSTFFTITDADGDTISRYRFFDGTAGNGQFTLNGVAQATLANIEITAAQLANMQFALGAPGTSDTLWVQAFDGFGWSGWTSFAVTAPQNAAPVASINAASLNPAKGATTVAAASFFSAVDPDSDPITQYRFFDGTAGNGRFELNGTPEIELQNITIGAADLANFRFRTSTSGSDTLWVQAHDGMAWGAWKSFTVAAPVNVAPTVNVQNLSPAKADTFIAGVALFTVTDPDDAGMAKYRFFDGTAGNGRFSLNGNLQAELANVEIDAADLANFRYVTSTTGTGDTLWVQAYDGFAWGAWKSFTVAAPPNNAPVVAVANIAPAVGTTSISAQTLFAVTDADHDTITQYRFFDGTAGNGHFVVNGVSQAELQNLTVDAADLANTAFAVSTRPGTSDTLWVQAYDGTAWSAWKSFTVSDSAPQVRFSVTIEDPQNQLSAYHNAISSTLQAAANLWSYHLAGDAHLEIRIRFFDANGSNRASGQSATGVNIGSHAGNVLFEEGTQYEIRTGIDPNGSSPDIEITATEDYIKNFLWFDPNPSTRTTPVPLNRNDAVSIFVHELGHALGFNGWIGSAPGFESEYDSHIMTSGGHRFFDGANATALYGGAVPLTDNNGTHLGNAAPLPGSDLADDTMGGVVAKFGVRTEPTALDLAILNDLGVAIKAGTEQRDVLSVVVANGGTIDGRGGDDLLRGSSGNDTLIGGAGSDTIGFSGARSDYVIAKANGTITVADQRAGGGDGTDTLSEVEFLRFSDGTIAANRGPMVAVGDLAPGRAVTAIAAANLFSVSDPDGDAMAQYRFFDGTGGNGRFELNGMALAELQNITISASDFANFRYVTSTTGMGDTLWVQAYDGVAWSAWKSFNVAAPANVAPTVNVQNLSPAKADMFIAGASLFTVTDPDDAGMAKYRFFDGTAGNGRFALNGNLQSELANIEINAADLANFRYVTSTTGTGDTLWVEAFDGFAWSAWKSFTVAAPTNVAPTVFVEDIVYGDVANVFDASALFVVSDPDDANMVRYRFWDSEAGSGYFQLNGVAQQEQRNIDIAAADLSNLDYVGISASRDTIWVQAFDGVAWGQWKTFEARAWNYGLSFNSGGAGLEISTPIFNEPAVVTVSNTTAQSGTAVSISSLLSASDPEGDTIMAWRFRDTTSGRGVLRLDGIVQADLQQVEVMASQLATVEFLTGGTPGFNKITASAFDGTSWSDPKTFIINTLVPV